MEEKEPLRHMMCVVVLSKVNEMTKLWYFSQAVSRYGWFMTGSNITKEQSETYDEWCIFDDHKMAILEAESLDSVNTILKNVHKFGANTIVFRDPDFGDRVVAFSFIVDERVFDEEKYPDYKEYIRRWSEEHDTHSTIDDGNGGTVDVFLAVQYITPSIDQWARKFFGGENPEKYIKLRDIIKSKKIL